MVKVRNWGVWGILIVCMCMSIPALGNTIGFSTGGANNYSWTVDVVAGPVVTMSFINNEIDTSDPTPDVILNDAIDLPDMGVLNIMKFTIAPGVEIITAQLVPVVGGLVTINADVVAGSVNAGDTVLWASLGAGGMLTIGSNFIAYSQNQDDIDIVGYVAGYSNVLDGFAAFDALGYDVDLSFSGDAYGLFNLLDTLTVGSISGVLSGQIVAVPEPFTLGILALGGGWLLLSRRKIS